MQRVGRQECCGCNLLCHLQPAPPSIKGIDITIPGLAAAGDLPVAAIRLRLRVGVFIRD